MIYVDEWAWKNIICLLEVLVDDFVEVDEALLQGVDRPRKLILCFLGME
jgi:hypothetical protein